VKCLLTRDTVSSLTPDKMSTARTSTTHILISLDPFLSFPTQIQASRAASPAPPDQHAPHLPDSQGAHQLLEGEHPVEDVRQAARPQRVQAVRGQPRPLRTHNWRRTGRPSRQHWDGTARLQVRDTLKSYYYYCWKQYSDFENLRIFSNYLQAIIKNALWDPIKYIYLESARRDLQNDEIYLMSRFAKFLRI